MSNNSLMPRTQKRKPAVRMRRCILQGFFLGSRFVFNVTRLHHGAVHLVHSSFVRFGFRRSSPRVARLLTSIVFSTICFPTSPPARACGRSRHVRTTQLCGGFGMGDGSCTGTLYVIVARRSGTMPVFRAAARADGTGVFIASKKGCELPPRCVHHKSFRRYTIVRWLAEA